MLALRLIFVLKFELELCVNKSFFYVTVQVAMYRFGPFNTRSE